MLLLLCTGTRQTFLIPPQQAKRWALPTLQWQFKLFSRAPKQATPLTLPFSLSYLALLCSHPLVVWPTIFCWHCVLCLIGTPAKWHTHTVPLSHTHTHRGIQRELPALSTRSLTYHHFISISIYMSKVLWSACHAVSRAHPLSLFLSASLPPLSLSRSLDCIY